MIPSARQGHIGSIAAKTTNRSNTSATQKSMYTFIVYDMLATGNSAVHAINVLNKRSTRHKFVLSLVAAPEGVQTS